MDRQDELKDEETIAEFVLTDEDMMIILRSLDLYGYALMMSENVVEVLKVKAIVLKVLTQLPRQDLNS
jgi:hypothetical protein